MKLMKALTFVSILAFLVDAYGVVAWNYMVTSPIKSFVQQTCSEDAYKSYYTAMSEWASANASTNAARIARDASEDSFEYLVWSEFYEARKSFYYNKSTYTVKKGTIMVGGKPVIVDGLILNFDDNVVVTVYLVYNYKTKKAYLEQSTVAAADDIYEYDEGPPRTILKSKRVLYQVYKNTILCDYRSVIEVPSYYKL